MRHMKRNSYFKRKVKHLKTHHSHTVPPNSSPHFSFYSHMYIKNTIKEEEKKTVKTVMKEAGTQLKSRKLPTDFNRFSL